MPGLAPGIQQGNGTLGTSCEMASGHLAVSPPVRLRLGSPVPARGKKIAALAKALRYSDGMLGSGSKVCVRKGKVADAAALADVFRESWQLAYRGIIPHAQLEGYIRQRTPEWWRGAVRSGEGTLVLELDGKVVGYATFGSARNRGPYQGEIYELYLDPVCQGLGFGERLFEACRHTLDMRKVRGLIVWALLANTPACDFYWRRGGRPIATAFTKIGGAKLEKVAFAWR